MFTYEFIFFSITFYMIAFIFQNLYPFRLSSVFVLVCIFASCAKKLDNQDAPKPNYHSLKVDDPEVGGGNVDQDRLDEERCKDILQRLQKDKSSVSQEEILFFCRKNIEKQRKEIINNINRINNKIRDIEAKISKGEEVNEEERSFIMSTLELNEDQFAEYKKDLVDQEKFSDILLKLRSDIEVSAEDLKFFGENFEKIHKEVIKNLETEITRFAELKINIDDRMKQLKSSDRYKNDIAQYKETLDKGFNTLEEKRQSIIKCGQDVVKINKDILEKIKNILKIYNDSEKKQEKMLLIREISVLDQEHNVLSSEYRQKEDSFNYFLHSFMSEPTV